jgi:NTP pyrophosphatase (non-canonical NTP hydrolase)
MLTDEKTNITNLKQIVKDFVNKRNWEHNPKNLAEAICIEAAELLEIFQWVSNKEALYFREDHDKKMNIREELADVLIYIISLANKMEIDISQAIKMKMRKNERKYPVNNYEK